MLDNREKQALKKKYYSKNSASQVLGCLMRDSDLLLDTARPLKIGDFVESFHEYVFEAIYWLKQDGMTDIDVNEIREYLKRDDSKKYKVVFEINVGNQVIVDMEKHANISNYKYHYEKIRKMSLLRDMIDDDVDVTPILDKQKTLERSVREEQELTFDEWTINDIVEKLLEQKSMKYKMEYAQYTTNEYSKIGDNIQSTIEHIKRGDVYGKLGQGKIRNAITLGAHRKKFIIKSAASGVGKTRAALEELVSIVAPEIYSHEKEEFIVNPNNPFNELSGIYLGTEMELEEVEIILWAVISGIETDYIKDYNNLTDEQKDRLEYTFEIAKRTNIHKYLNDDYDTKTVEHIVKQHKKNGEDVYALAVDYLEITPAVIQEYCDAYHKRNAQDHKVARYMSKRFKDIANQQNIYITSSTQLNRQSTEHGAQIGANMIRGSFAIPDKADFASITLDITETELEVFREAVAKHGGIYLENPNFVEHIYKQRGRRYSEAKIFKYVNRGHMEIKDLLVTDNNYELIDIERIEPKTMSYEERDKLIEEYENR